MIGLWLYMMERVLRLVLRKDYLVLFDYIKNDII